MSTSVHKNEKVDRTRRHIFASHPVCRHSEVLQVLEEAHVRVDAGQVVVTQVQEAQLVAEEQLTGDLLDLVPVQIQPLQVGQRSDLNGDVGDLVVPQLQAHQPVQVLEADDLLDGLQVVVLQVDLLQVVQAEDGVRDALQVAADELQLRQVDHLLQAVEHHQLGALVVDGELLEVHAHVRHHLRQLGQVVLQPQHFEPLELPEPVDDDVAVVVRAQVPGEVQLAEVLQAVDPQRDLLDVGELDVKGLQGLPQEGESRRIDLHHRVIEPHLPQAGELGDDRRDGDVGDELQLEHLQLDQVEHGVRDAAEHEEVQLQLLLGVLGDALPQLLQRPLVVQVQLPQLVLAHLRQEHGEALGVERVVLVDHVQHEGKVVLQVGDVAVAALLADGFKGVALEGAADHPAQGVHADEAVHHHQADVETGQDLEERGQGVSAVEGAVAREFLQVHRAHHAEGDEADVVGRVADDQDELDDFDDGLADVKAVHDVALLHVDPELLHLLKQSLGLLPFLLVQHPGVRAVDDSLLDPGLGPLEHGHAGLDVLAHARGLIQGAVHFAQRLGVALHHRLGQSPGCPRGVEALEEDGDKVLQFGAGAGELEPEVAAGQEDKGVD